MPRTHVALLRGINVGKAKRIAMADLRALVEELGYSDVKTLLNSGNVVFTIARGGGARGNPAERIEKAIVTRLGISSRVTVLTAAEVSSIVSNNPLLAMGDNHSRLFAAVLATPEDRKVLQPLTRQRWAPEALAIGERVAWHWCPDGIAESRLAVALGKVLGDKVTTRNWATMLKLQALLDAT